MSKGLDLFVRQPYYKSMLSKNELKLNIMLDSLVKIVDGFNSTHRKGHDFGSGVKLYPAEIHTIQAIGDNPGITVTKLSKLLGVTKATVSERIGKLAKRSLVSKSQAEDNAKDILLKLTTDGKADYKGHLEHHRRIFQLFYENMKDPENTIERLTGAFQEYLNICEKIGPELDCHTPG